VNASVPLGARLLPIHPGRFDPRWLRARSKGAASSGESWSSTLAGGHVEKPVDMAVQRHREGGCVEVKSSRARRPGLIASPSVRATGKAFSVARSREMSTPRRCSGNLALLLDARLLPSGVRPASATRREIE